MSYLARYNDAKLQIDFQYGGIYNVYTLWIQEDLMIKRMIKHGNSWAIVIDRSVLDLLRIDPKDLLDVSTDGKSLIVSPIDDPKRRHKLLQALEKSDRKFGRMYQRLARAPGAHT